MNHASTLLKSLEKRTNDNVFVELIGQIGKNNQALYTFDIFNTDLDVSLPRKQCVLGLLKRLNEQLNFMDACFI